MYLIYRMRAAGYIRVSTEEQVVKGISLDAQEKKIRAFSLAKDWRLIKVYGPTPFGFKIFSFLTKKSYL